MAYDFFFPDAKKLLWPVISLREKQDFILLCARWHIKTLVWLWQVSTVTFVPLYSCIFPSITVVRTTAFILKFTMLPRGSLGTSRTYLAQKKGSSLKETSYPPFSFPPSLSLAPSVYCCAILVMLFLLLWVWSFSPPLILRAGAEILNRSPAWPSSRTTASPCPTETQPYWLQGCSDEGGEPSLPSIISHHLSSWVLHLDIPPPPQLQLQEKGGESTALSCSARKPEPTKAPRDAVAPGFFWLDEPVTSSALKHWDLWGSTVPSIMQHPAQRWPSQRLEMLLWSWVWQQAQLLIPPCAISEAYFQETGTLLLPMWRFWKGGKGILEYLPSPQNPVLQSIRKYCSAHQGTIGSLLCFGNRYGNQLSQLLCPAAQGTVCPRDAALDLQLRA